MFMGRRDEMKFMHVYEKPELLEEATGLYSNPVAVLAQMDVHTVHVFTIAEIEEGHLVEMFEAQKETRTSIPSDEEMGED
jgi:hypothetical protein